MINQLIKDLKILQSLAAGKKEKFWWPPQINDALWGDASYSICRMFKETKQRD